MSGTTHWAPPPTPPSSPQLTHPRLSKPLAQHPTPPKLLHRQPRSLLPLPPSQTLPNHQVPLIGLLHRHHPPAPSSLILGSLSLPPSTRHHPSSYTGDLGACSPLPPSQTLPNHQVPLIGHLHRHHPPPPSSLILTLIIPTEALLPGWLLAAVSFAV